VDLGEVLFVPGPFTIEEWSVEVGDQVGGGPAAVVYDSFEAVEGDDVAVLETALARLGFDTGGAM
ncbi:MAG: hypothetical protein GWN79_00920, partial [Actinobacteria bacterium]|nr:hypothetical protein [Actinomycetota bacterium]NIS30437.1 hypothetical protein [Actinomycetota bacterium]NIU17738.1 hypothetical protein [Actinomycetota bacterium]NIU65668.1 hypothetical protein [Actinomycetota bacterium]NIV85527.1 hypothetical protein [Actinomycetota bacterium]